MKTFSEVLEEYGSYNVFPITDTPLNTLITQWYESRYIGADNDADFIRFFKRIYNNEYNRYYQILRLDPKVTEYDWLVQTYRERQKTNDVAINASNNSTTAGTHTGTETGTHSGTGSENATRTLNTQDNNTLSKSGSDTTQTARNGSIHGTSSVNSRRDEDIDQTVTTETQSDTFTDAGAESLTKTAPMSVSYSSNGAVHNKTYSGAGGTAQGDDIRGLDFTYADGQTLSNNRGIAKNSVDDTVDTSAQNQYTEVTSNQNSGTTSETTDKDYSYDGYETGHKTQTGTITDVKSNLSNKTDSINKSLTDTVRVSGASGSKSEALEREIWTGRDKEVAELLARACTYISQTDAWAWLMEKLDICFYGIYE